MSFIQSLLKTGDIEYVNSILLMDLDSLLQEQRVLEIQEQEMDRKRIQTTEVGFKDFIAAHQVSSKISDRLSKLPHSLETILKYPIRVQSALDKVEQSRQRAAQSHEEINRVLSQLNHLEPLLEIPTLFDTLVRNGNHEEAMELQLFVQRLPVRYPNVTFFTRLATTETNSQEMLIQLLTMLRGPVKLPLCIRVIGYLRRLGFKDTTLRILFLSLRYDYLSSLREIVKESQPHEYVRRWIETQREHFLDIITHYKAIFPDTTRADSTAQILASFASLVVSSTLQMVATFLSNVEDVSLVPSINTQVMYYGASLGRIGLDFRPLVVTMFEDAVARVVKGNFDQAATSFKVDTTKLERPVIDTPHRELLLKSMAVSVLYNQLMNGLNQLRYLPCRSLHSSLVVHLEVVMQIVVDKIVLARGTNKREAEIVAWIVTEAVIPTVFAGLDSVLASSVRTDYSSFVQQLGPLIEFAQNHRISTVEAPIVTADSVISIETPTVIGESFTTLNEPIEQLPPIELE